MADAITAESFRAAVRRLAEAPVVVNWDYVELEKILTDNWVADLLPKKKPLIVIMVDKNE